MHVLFYVWKGELHYLTDDNPITIDNATLPEGFLLSETGKNTDDATLNGGLQKFVPSETSKESETHAVLDTEALREITKSFGIVIRDGQAMVSSREVARVFGRPHRSVLSSIRTVQCSEKFRYENFRESYYYNEQNKKQPAYYMTRDGFTFMVMGFTGHVAAEFKEAYIEAFNVMEKALEGQRVSG